ncbi:MAG: SUMF1/EgtB/PvdO family nonheme iron enzyme [Spirochaetales bacterium]|nr:SUMF1/EgtB/PvdO family nonheme iron enzyme [Spirochaetales bacterium]
MFNNRIGIKIILISILFFLSLSVFSQEMVSVLDFNAEGGISEYEASTLRSLFETELIGSGRYTVIEKAQQDQVINAQMDTLKGCVDDACAVEIGELLSADRILLGSVARIGSLHILTVKIIDIQTSRSEKAESIRADSIEGLIEKISILVDLLTEDGESGGTGRIIYEDEPSDGGTSSDSSQSSAETGRAYVVLKSTPENITFTLKTASGEELKRGRTPQSLPLGLATYVLEARDDEGLYIPFSENLVVNRSGRMTYEIRLEPDFGNLSVTSTPSGMQVLSGGIMLGTTPYRNDSFKSGSYNIVVKDPDGLYISHSLSLTMAPGELKSLNAILDPNFVELSVRETNNLPGKIYVEGVYDGELPWSENIPFRDVSIKVVPDDSRYYPYEVTIQPRSGGESIIKDFAFTGKCGFLIVESEPFTEGELFVDGINMGIFPNMVELFTGSHEVEIKTEVEGTSMVGKGQVVISEGEEIMLTLTLENAMPPFIFVDGGTFQMGSTSGDSDEKPVHSVTVGDFMIGQYEVTQKLYRDVVGSNPSDINRGIGDNYPVNMVSWNDAISFCNKLSEREGFEPVYRINGSNVTCDWSKNGYRLPTEAEWEFAARGGNDSQGYTYAGSSSSYIVAWFSGIETHPVGGKSANELGIYDMSGNVWEWCWDWRGRRYESGSQRDPHGASSGSQRVFRGGGWFDSYTYSRSTNRGGDVPRSRGYDLGFRLVLPSFQ